MSLRTRTALVIAGGLLGIIVVGQLVLPGRKPSAAGKQVAESAGATPSTSPASPGAAASRPEAAALSPLRATTMVAGVPMGYRHDVEGARAAAVGFARAYGTLVALDEAGAVEARRTMASNGAAERLVADTRARLVAMRRSWPVGAISYRVAPLAVRVRMEGGDAAAADVWYVGVVAARGVPTYEEWVTETYRLVWERDDWRIASDVETAGPRPDPGRQAPASPAELEARLVGFEAVR